MLIDSVAGQPQCAIAAQTGRERPLQGSASLNGEGPVNGLVADAHGRVLGELHLQTLRDLFRAPGRRPAPALPMNGAPPLPYHDRTVEGDAFGRGDEAGESVLHMVRQGGIACRLAGFRAPCCAISMPLRGDGAIVEVPAARRRVAPDLSRNRAR